jgi:linoleoyl-CoA desaturase
VPYFLREFVFWPALAGPLWWKVLGGNVLAEVIRNAYTCATIYAGHFGDDLQYRDRDFRPGGRGRWYRMQIGSAHDYSVPFSISVLCGALDYQIEHHLFPRLPPNRLREIAPKVEAICVRYGVRYSRDTWGGNLWAALKRLGRMSLPPRVAVA